jgi:putative phage-type endonuclease
VSTAVICAHGRPKAICGECFPMDPKYHQAPAVLGDTRERWLARRRELVTASDCAAILGYDPRRGPLAVYAEKIGAVEGPEGDWLEFGRDVEGAIAKGYARKTGRPVRDLGGHELQVHPDCPWLAATLDRETEGCELLPAPAGVEGPAPLELKAVGGRAVGGWRDEEPQHFVIQVQIQMACTARQWGALGAMFHGMVGSIEPRDVPRNDRFLRAALPVLEAFHLRVKRRQPPEEVDALPATSYALRHLFADTDGETIPLDHAALEAANRLERAKQRLEDATEEAEELANRLRRIMGPAAFGALPDGSFLSLKVTPRRGYTRTL